MATETRLEDQIAALWRSVTTLSLPATSQIEILAAMGNSSAVDELALDFDDNFWAVQMAFDRGMLTDGEYAALNNLNRQLDAMSGSENELFWTKESLKNDRRWTKIRDLARAALKEHQISHWQSSVTL